MKEISTLSLPQTFQKRMADLLGPELPDFLASYLRPRSNSLRVNTLKITPEDFAALGLFPLKPVPWCPEGFYYAYQDYPGKHPYHQAGVYYIQEPSAMAVAAYLDPRPGDCVLDLAAAPGGKSTQIASSLQGQGLLWSNEIDRKRSRILLENLERWGTARMIVSCETPENLSQALPGFFHKILLDAPCSGEGMFRKDPGALRHWSVQHVLSCAFRQQKILESAASLLKEGGTLVYSTCTFSPEENEYCIINFLNNHPDFGLEPLPKLHPDFVESALLPGTIRLYPHRVDGEGHFIARLMRKPSSAVPLGEKTAGQQSREKHLPGHHQNTTHRQGQGNTPNKKTKSPDLSLVSDSEIFSDLRDLLRPEAGDLLSDDPSSGNPSSGNPSSGNPSSGDLSSGGLFSSGRHSLISHEGHYWLDPLAGKLLPKLNILCRGLYLGQKKTGRFLPGYALAHAQEAGHFKEYSSFLAGSLELEAYLHGEEISSPGPDGWTVIGVDSFPLGWGRRSGGRLKNHYPKNLRQ